MGKVFYLTHKKTKPPQGQPTVVTYDLTPLACRLLADDAVSHDDINMGIFVQESL